MLGTIAMGPCIGGAVPAESTAPLGIGAQSPHGAREADGIFRLIRHATTARCEDASSFSARSQEHRPARRERIVQLRRHELLQHVAVGQAHQESVGGHHPDGRLLLIEARHEA